MKLNHNIKVIGYQSIDAVCEVYCISRELLNQYIEKNGGKVDTMPFKVDRYDANTILCSLYEINQMAAVALAHTIPSYHLEIMAQSRYTDSDIELQLYNDTMFIGYIHDPDNYSKFSFDLVKVSAHALTHNNEWMTKFDLLELFDRGVFFKIDLNLWKAIEHTWSQSQWGDALTMADNDILRALMTSGVIDSPYIITNPLLDTILTNNCPSMVGWNYFDCLPTHKIELLSRIANHPHLLVQLARCKMEVSDDDLGWAFDFVHESNFENIVNVLELLPVSPDTHDCSKLVQLLEDNRSLLPDGLTKDKLDEWVSRW